MFKRFLFLLPGLAALSSCNAAPQPPQPVQQIIQPGDRTSGQSESTLTLAENGKALQPIIIAADASDAIKATAQYLAERLKKITGAEFEIKNGDGTSGIVIGTIRQFPVTALQKPLAVRPVLQGSDIPNGVEAYGIRVEPKRLLLLGGGEPGADHAAARFLELLGYRQFYPSPEWEIVPKLSTLKFDRDETDRPSIPARHIWYAFGIPREPYTSETADWPVEKRNGRSKEELDNWYRQNRLGESFHVFAAHNWALIINNNKDAFAAHPEYYSLIGGKRVPRSICVGNTAVRRMAVQNALDYFAQHPDATMFSMERGDGNASCECDLCKALGNESNRVFGLANEVAKAVAKKYPGKMIGVLAYNTHDLPPDFAMEPNVHVQVARLFSQSGLPFHERVAMWAKKTKNLGIYDYFSTYQWGQDRLRPKANAGPTGNLELLTDDIPFLAREGVLSLWSETSVAWGAHGRGNLVATRLMWNPDADVNAIVADFYDKAFGPAAPAMKRYFERVDGQNEYFSKTLLGLAFRDVDEAARLAQGRPDVEARIDWIKRFLSFNYLQQRVFETRGTPEEKSWVLQFLTHQFRTRYEYMTHWQAQSNFLADAAKKYNEPSWALPNWKEVAAAKKEGKTIPNPPWLDWNPYTHEETEARFQEGLKYFQPKTLLPEAKYSDDLVPVEFPGAPEAKPSVQVQSGPATIYLYSIKGEPLEIEIKTGKTGDPQPYVLRDRTGKMVAQGELPQDDAAHALNLKVPAAGLYTLEYSGRGWWSYSVPPGRPNTLSLREKVELWRYTMQGLSGRNFFYVPKGTKQIQYFWDGVDHSVIDPSGKATKVTDRGDYITLDVPEGMDGKVWSFTSRYDTRHFINLPDYVAPSPQALLVPREVAEKDGLTLRR